MRTDDRIRRECSNQPFEAGDAQALDQAAQPIGDFDPLRLTRVGAGEEQPPQQRRPLAHFEVRTRIGLPEDLVAVAACILNPHLAAPLAASLGPGRALPPLPRLKLTLRPPRGGVLLRPDLQARLPEIRLNPLTLRIAPGGYGTTTLLAQ